MKDTSDTRKLDAYGGRCSVDTTFVLFFLALEYGRSFELLSIEGIVMAITMSMVLVLPYSLPSEIDKPPFASWLIGRGSIALFGVLLGVAFKQSLGVVLPDALRSMPMTFLILASMISCYIQFYGLMKLRLAK